MSDDAIRLQVVEGRCLACGERNLFVAHGNHVTCGWSDCPDPTGIARLLEMNANPFDRVRVLIDILQKGSVKR